MKDRDVVGIKTPPGSLVVFRNCTFDSWMDKPDGTIEEKHQDFNPKTMKWEDRKPKRQKR